jgi:hypothetical protein
VTTPNDPFQTPTPRASAFPSAASFRGRLVLIRPTKIEHNIPKQAGVPNGPTGDRVTANVTVVDGQGPVQVFGKDRQPTGKWLDGPEHRGVWFNQDQLASGLQDVRGNLLELVLARIETLQPGTAAGQGNPWVFQDPSEEDKDMARKFLANQMVGGASAPTQSQSKATVYQGGQAVGTQYQAAPQQPAAAPQQPAAGPFAGAPASTGVPAGPPF